MDANDRRRRAGQEAAEWLVLLDSEAVSLKKRGEFVDWLRESSLHVEEMLRVAQVHGALERFRGWQRIVSDQEGTTRSQVAESDNVVSFPPPSSATTRSVRAAPRRVFAWVGIGLAAAATAALVAWFGVFSRSYTIETGQGEQREIALSDGSVVKTDPETLLRIKFDDRLRQIDLRRGRALFRVAKNPLRPFLVRAGGTVVRAVGTEFGVEHRPQGIVITVAEGRVAVLPREGEAFPFSGLAFRRQPSGAISADAPLGSGRGSSASSAVIVSTGQQLTVTPRGSPLGVREVNAARELSWAEGKLTFDNDSVATVVGMFNRYNNLQIHIADATLADRTMSGVFNASDPESFIAFLQSVASVRVVRNGRDITIGSKR